MSTNPNPLLGDYDRIPFSKIEAVHVVPAVRQILRDARAEIEDIVSNESAPTYADTIERLDSALEWVKERTGPVTHLLSVAETRWLSSSISNSV